jgi:hypothetical protein
MVVRENNGGKKINKSRLKSPFIVSAVLLAGLLTFYVHRLSTVNNPRNSFAGQSVAKSDAILARAFANRLSNLRVAGQGVVTDVLPDDNSGIRHQRFIVRLGTGQTVLIEHNIDIAAKIRAIREGDTVRFFGEYEWNDKGGVIHYTHRDPKARHPGGWVEIAGKRYE